MIVEDQALFPFTGIHAISAFVIMDAFYRINPGLRSGFLTFWIPAPPASQRTALQK